jgi:hypothetical protein
MTMLLFKHKLSFYYMPSISLDHHIFKLVCLLHTHAHTHTHTHIHTYIHLYIHIYKVSFQTPHIMIDAFLTFYFITFHLSFFILNIYFYFVK